MSNKILGVFFILVGVAQFVWGYNIYDSALAEENAIVDTDFPVEAWACLIVGSICLAVGGLKIK